MAGGYIKLYRQILDNPVVCKDSDHFAVWCYLLLNATHDNYDVVFGKERVTLEPGQLITGRKSISSKLNIDESKVRRVLNLFENDQQISRQRSNKNSLITILKWNLYQGNDQQNEQQVTNKRPTSDQQVTTNKNVNTHNNVNKNDNTKHMVKSHQEQWFDTFWKIYPKKVNRAGALKSFLKKVNSEEILNKIVSDVNAKSKSVDWLKESGQYIPHATTYLNQDRWNDVVEISSDEMKPLFPLDEIEKMRQELAAIGSDEEEVNENE